MFLLLRSVLLFLFALTEGLVFLPWKAWKAKDFCCKISFSRNNQQIFRPRLAIRMYMHRSFPEITNIFTNFLL